MAKDSVKNQQNVSIPTWTKATKATLKVQMSCTELILEQKEGEIHTPSLTAFSHYLSNTNYSCSLTASLFTY